MNRIRLLLATLVAVLAFAGLAAGTASAQGQPAPPSCAVALAAFVQAETDLSGARASLEGAQGQLASLEESLPGLRAAVDAAIAADNVATPPLTQDSAATVAAKAALATTTSQRDAARAVVATATARVTELTTVLAQAELTADVACQGPSGQPPTTTPTTPPTTPPPGPADIDCADVTDSEAQRILEADPSDPNGLDADNDGNACDEDEPEDTTPGGSVSDTTGFSQVRAVPVGPIRTGSA